MTAARYALFTSLLLFLGGPSCALAKGTFQGWYQNTLWWRLNEQVSLGNYVDFRIDDAVREKCATQYSPRIRFDVNRYLQLQINTSWTNSLNPAQTDRSSFFRLEFEVNPNYSITDELIFSMRNRLELRWNEDGDFADTRIRIRPQVEWFFNKEGIFRGVYANNEIFYNFTEDRVTENRFIPIGVILHPAKPLDLRFSFMWRTAVGGNEWFNYYIAGISTTVSF